MDQVNRSKIFPKALLSVLYISVCLHRVQVTVVNFRLCTSNSLDRKPPVALNSLDSYSACGLGTFENDRSHDHF